MKKWETYKLDDIATKLGDGLHGTPKYDDAGEYYFINGSNLVNGKIVINSNTKRVAKEEYNKYKKELSNRTILLGINGTIGNIALYNNEKCILGKSACYINVSDKFDKAFVKYVLLNHDFQNHIKTNATGTTIKNVGLKLLREYQVLIPPGIEDQIQIASILSSLDDKIEINLQMNQTLEAMAQAIFKEWFVEFRFPGADGVLVEGLPKGWKRGSVLEIADLLSGGTPKTEVEKYWDGEIKWISAKDVTANNGNFVLSTEKSITKEGLKNSAAKLLPKYSTVISARGTVGNYCIISEEMAISQSNYALKFKNEDGDFFLFLMLENMIEMMKAYSYGTVFDTITTKTFKEMEVIIPDAEKIILFNSLVRHLYLKIHSNSIQNQTLTNLRDSLLPKLMTGKIEIK